MQTQQPETALERALVDREEACARLERELNKERTSAQTRTKTMQRRLEEALKKVAAATKDNEAHLLAIDSARRAHEADLADGSKREKHLQTELASTKVLPPCFFLCFGSDFVCSSSHFTTMTSATVLVLASLVCQWLWPWNDSKGRWSEVGA